MQRLEKTSLKTRGLVVENPPKKMFACGAGEIEIKMTWEKIALDHGVRVRIGVFGSAWSLD